MAMVRAVIAGAPVLVLNAGSSSLKASVIGPGEGTLAAAETPWDGEPSGAAAAVDQVLAAGTVDRRSVAAVGHRVVHGGSLFVGPARVDDEMLGRLATLRPLAPLHNPLAEAVIAAARPRFPLVPHVASFDTAFHSRLAPGARLYPLPWDWYERWGVRRYGFHGLSVQWAVRRAADLLQRPAAKLSLVVAHLGSGCSVTAVRHGTSVDTSMGMTPLEGLMMATRSGSVDPGILLAVQQQHGISAVALERILERDSGVLGIAGTGDMREVLARAARADVRASLALELFVRRAAAGIAAAATALAHLDAVVFTGGIGARSATIRDAISARLGTLSVSVPGGPVTLAIESREDLIVANEARSLLGLASAAG